MRLSKETIQKRYADIDPRAQEFLYNVFDDIKKQNQELNNYFLVSFDLLANQLKLYFSAVDGLEQAKNLTSEDAYQRVAKSPLIAVMQKCHTEIMKIMNEFSMSPFGQARLKRVKGSDDGETAADLLAVLTE